VSRDPHFLRPGRGVERGSLRRKRRYRLVVAAGVLLLAAAVVLSLMAYSFVTNPRQFTVSRILVEGAEFADRELVEATVRELTGGNVLMVDLREVCAAVERLPWVRRAQARKVLPDTLQLTLDERLPTAYVLLGGEIFLTDGTGTVIDRLRPEHPFIGLPVIRGVDGLPEAELQERLRLATAMLDELRRQRPAWYDRVSEIEVAEPRRLSVLLGDRTAPIIVGDRDAVARLGKYFSIEAELDRRYDSPEYIDVRYERRLYIKPGGEEALGQGR